MVPHLPSVCKTPGYRRKEEKGIWNSPGPKSLIKGVLVLWEQTGTSHILHQPGEYVFREKRGRASRLSVHFSVQILAAHSHNSSSKVLKDDIEEAF